MRALSDLIDTTEMYLRTILDLEEEDIVPLRARIAERLEHSGPTVSQTVARMERDGYLHLTQSRQLELTELGRQRAIEVMRKHRLAERLLSDVIGLDWPHIHEEACRWEHVMSERVERRLVEILEDPVDSPYGNPIPGLDKLGVDVPAPATPLPRTTMREAAESYDGSVEARYSVHRLAESIQVEPDVLEQLQDVGLRPGVHISVTGFDEAYALLTVDDVDQGPVDIELPLEIAQHIYIAPRT